MNSQLKLLALTSIYCLLIIKSEAANEQQPLRPWLKNRGLSLRAAPSTTSSTTTTTTSTTTSTTTTTTTTTPAPNVSKEPKSSQQQAFQNLRPIQSSGIGTAIEVLAQAKQQQQQQQTNSRLNNNNLTNVTNRITRTAEIFDHNIIVTNTCERESMKVNIKTSRDFFGVIHTRNQRSKAVCSIEGNGDREYNLEISHVLNQQDPNYCGVIKARKNSPEDKDILSVVLAVRFNRNIELSDDKFFLLNCTNRCRKPDCSLPANAKLTDNNNDLNNRLTDDEVATDLNNNNNNNNANGERENSDARDRNPGLNDECTIWKFPWLITLLWCLGILLLAMIIANCIICSSMICKCVRTEVEEREPSVYEGATDYDDDDDGSLNVKYNNSGAYNKKNPYTIDYDNRDIYKTSNNYEPYNLEEAQTKASSRRKHRKNSR